MLSCTILFNKSLLGLQHHTLPVHKVHMATLNAYRDMLGDIMCAGRTCGQHLDEGSVVRCWTNA